MVFFDFIANSAKDAMRRQAEQKFEEYKSMGYGELKDWIPQITNNWEKVVAIMALYDSGDRSNALYFIQKFNLPKSSFERFATNSRMGNSARNIVRSLNDGWVY